jgi:hypothetical protein
MQMVKRKQGHYHDGGSSIAFFTPLAITKMAILEDLQHK